MVPQPAPTGDTRRQSNLAPRQPAARRWRHAFGLFSGYWTSKDWKFAWFALIVLIGFQFGMAYIMIAANQWERSFFDSVEQRDTARFATLLMAFLGILAMSVGSIVLEGWIDRVLSIRWRTFLTERYVDRWMSSNRFAEIERLRMIDNPDQRISIDLELFTNAVQGSLSVALGFIGATVRAVSFAYILLETAEPIRFSAFGTAISIPGSTIWYAVAYALVGSVIMAKVGKPYVRALMRQEHAEADFRSNLMHVRRNAAQIGLAGAIPTERQSLRQSFAEVRHNFRSVIYTTLGLRATQSVYERLDAILPLFLMVPRYFAGAITFGQVMAARDAFNRLVGSLSYFVQAYPSIGKLVSNVNRLKGLDDAIDYERPQGITLRAGTPVGIAIATEALIVRRPHGQPLVDVGTWSVRGGERWAVRGASGVGKSTLLRAIAGLWPDGTGDVGVTADTVATFVPQRLYLPLGTLKGAVCFPDRPEQHDDAAIAALLHRVRLSELADDIHALRMWQEELSPGEQQRVALARILLHRPTLLVLDEATSALDPDNARHFYDCVLQDLEGATIVSVVHDEDLLAHHTHLLTIRDGRAVPAARGESAA